MNIQYFDQPLPSFSELLKRQPDYFELALTSKEAALALDSTPAALAQMRSRGTGPKYVRLPTITSMDTRSRPRGPIRYIRRDIIEWLQNQPSFSNTTEELVDNRHIGKTRSDIDQETLETARNRQQSKRGI